MSDLNNFVSLDCKVAVDSAHAHPKTSIYDVCVYILYTLHITQHTAR